MRHTGENKFFMPPDGSNSETYLQTKGKLVNFNVKKNRLSSEKCRNNGTCMVFYLFSD